MSQIVVKINMGKIEIFREITPLSSEDCFVIMNRTKNRFTYPIHVHPEYEINFIENAKGCKRIVGDSIEEIEEIELCLIGNEKLEHGWINNNHQNNGTIHEITIQFHRDLFFDSFLNKKQFQSLKILLDNAKRGIVFSTNTALKVKDKLNSLSNMENGFCSVVEFISILNELSMDEDRRLLSNRTFSDEEDSLESSRIYKVITFLQQNYKNEIHLSEVANHVCLTAASLSRFMKKHTGKNFVEYVNDLRLGIAARFLINTQNSIADISSECGFNNLSNFNRIFKKRKGTTPKAFRENYSKMRKLI